MPLIGAALIFFIFFIIQRDIKKNSSEYRSSEELDNKVFALYLRAFDDDLIKYNNTPNVIFPFGIPRFSVETTIIRELGKNISLVKVVDQSQEQKIGASGISLDNDWKEHVLDLMEKAQIILLKPAMSEGLIWEFDQIVAQNYLHKTILVLSYGNYDEPEIRELYKRRFSKMLLEKYKIKLNPKSIKMYLTLDDDVQDYSFGLYYTTVHKRWRENMKDVKESSDDFLIDIVENDEYEREVKILAELELMKRGFEIETTD